MPNRTVLLKGLQIARDIPYRDADALFSLSGVDGSGRSAYLPVGEQMLGGHTLLLGSPATGKSNMLCHMLRNLRAHLGQQDALVVLDPKGEYHRQFYQKGDVVFANDERAAGAAGEDAWNLFDELEEDDLTEDAGELVGTLFHSRIQAAPDPFYPSAAMELMTALIVYLRRQGGEPLQTNLALRELIDGFDVESMLKILDSLPELRGLAAYLSRPDSPKTLGVVCALQQAARELLQGRFRREGKLSMRELLEKREGRVIFVCYDAEHGAALGPVYCALIDRALKQALARRESAGHVYFLLDEMRLLPYLPHLEDALLLGAASGVRVLAGAASVTQLRAIYPGRELGALLCAFGTTVAFRLQERDSRQYVKALYGRHRVVESFTSSVQLRGVIEQVMDEYIIEDSDLTALQTGECIVATMHYPPFYFKLRRYGA